MSNLVTVSWYVPYVHRGAPSAYKRSARFSTTTQPKAIDYARNKPQTKEEAIKAITPYLKEAEQKAEAITALVRQLEKDHDCGISYFMDGDTYGIHEEFLYVGFYINGYSFTYELED